MTAAKNASAGESSDREIVITRDFNAPRELVWEAMTKPEHVVNWWGPRGFSTTIETMDYLAAATGNNLPLKQTN